MDLGATGHVHFNALPRRFPCHGAPPDTRMSAQSGYPYTGVSSVEHPLSHPKSGGSHPLLGLSGHYIRYNPDGSTPAHGQTHQDLPHSHQWLNKRNATKREILSLVGLLQHALPRLYGLAEYLCAECTVWPPKYKRWTTTYGSTKSFALTCTAWWHTFVASWNGISFLKVALGDPTPQVTIQTDASGT